MSDRTGTRGATVSVFTNMFRVSSLPKHEFYHYDVIKQQMANGPPKDVTVRRRAREIIEKLQDDNPKIFTRRASFDGMHNMYSIARIQQENFEVNLSKNPKATTGIFKVTIRNVSVVRPSDLQRLMSPDGANKSQANTTAVNLLQIIISQGPNIQHNFALHSKSFYINENVREIAPGLQLWHGFFQSVRPVLNNIMINIDTTAAPMFKAGSLLDIAMQYLGCRDPRQLAQSCSGERGVHTLRKLRAFYKGVTVTVPPNNKKGKIEDIVPCAGQFEFDKGGQMTTVKDHFQEHHRITIRFPDVFGIRSGRDAVFPAEVCQIVPGQLYKKKLDGRATSEVIKETAVRPEKRLEIISKAVSGNVLAYRNSPFMKDAGMNVETKPLEAQGRRLMPPGVLYGNGTLNVQGGAWNVVNRTFQLPARIVAWAVVSFDPTPNAKDAAARLATNLLRNMKNLGIEFYREQPYFCSGNEMNVADSLTRAAHQSTSMIQGGPKPGLVLVILPREAAPLRKQVKQWGDMMQGIPTQCVRAGKYESASDQYCNNVALKINAKAGGINSTLNSPVVPFLQQCMVVGCDVTHPSPGVTSRPSIASLVSSWDESATRYHTEVQVQPPRQEAIDNIGNMVKRAIVQYRQKRNIFPKTIVLYRDGVSEGEYAQVENNEIRAIQAVLDDLERDTKHKARLIFIVVGKRHHVRFFPKDRSDADRSGNLHPGLVIDSEVVHSTYVDFYLQSQGGLKGTSRPGHYVVLKNDAGLTVDQLQELSFALCHVYAAATRSVSIPAPVYYADRLCARADFQFRPELDYANETATNSSGSDFNLDTWKQGLGQAILNQQMYFV